ncbi:DUF2058 domain-containing protein [Desulfobacterota bacterium M19]
MGNPFQSQFLKAGVVSRKQVKKARHAKRLSRRKNAGENSSETVSPLCHEQEAHAARNRELNRQRAEEKRQHEQRAQIKQLIEENRLPLDERGEAYYFVEQKQIKRLFVNDEMREKLSCGQLAIVKYGKGYEVVPAGTSRQIASRDQEVVVVLHTSG